MNPLKNIISVGFFTLYFLSSNFSNSFASEHKNKIIEFFSDIDISGQATVIYQTSSLDLNASGLKNKNNNLLNESELKNYAHKNYDGSVSSDVILEKRFNEDDFFQIDFQFAYGLGVDTNLQGGSMVNNDIMEDEDDRNKIYIAKAFYEKTFDLNDKYKVTFDIGKFGVNDFFDIGEENSDQTKQFLNQAIANNGAFDYVQDLNGRGYTYGFRAGIFNDFYGFDFGFFSSDAILKNISEKNSIIGAFKLTPKFNDLKGLYQFYIFSNKGEYAAFNEDGKLLTKNASNINKANNKDDLNKNGFGISITQEASNKINIFAKFGKQDDDRDIRHYQDQDESYMIGANFNIDFWNQKKMKLALLIKLLD